MDSSIADAGQSSYTTAGRHRRDIGPGRIRLTVTGLALGHPGTEPPTLLVNGYAVAVGAAQTVLRVPAGEMLVEVRCAGARASRPVEVGFVLGEGQTADLRFTAPRLGLGTGRLELAGLESPAA